MEASVQQFYFADGDQQRGPVPVDQMRSAGVGPDTLVWRDGMSQWQAARTVPELAGLFAAAPAAAPNYPPAQGYQQPQAQGYPAAPQHPQAPSYPPATGFAPPPPPGFQPPGYPQQHGGYPQQPMGYPQQQ